MLHRPIYDEVMSRAARWANACHPSVAERYANELARYGVRRAGVLYGVSSTCG